LSGCSTTLFLSSIGFKPPTFLPTDAQDKEHTPEQLEPEPLLAVLPKLESAQDKTAPSTSEVVPVVTLAESAPSPRMVHVGCPPPPTAPLVQALQAFLDDRSSEAIAHLGTYHPRDQEFLLRVLPQIARVARGGLLTEWMDQEERLTLLDAMQGVTTDLRRTSPLVIEKAMFCQRVSAFGKLEPLVSQPLRPGDLVGVYAELRNLCDHRLAEERYAIHLVGRLEILNPTDTVVWNQTLQSDPDVSRSPRQDHFTVIQFRLPSNLDPGTYHLKVTLRDRETQREAETRIPFRVSNLAMNTVP
jgi:hypothetical protein